MTDKEKLENLILEIDNLVNHYVMTSTPAFQAWKNEAERFLIKKFGETSFERQNFVKTSFRPQLWTSNQDLIKACKNGLIATKMVFQTYLEELVSEDTINKVGSVEMSIQTNQRIFIVHGHDGELKEAVARIIEKQGIEAIILSEQANTGKTIIEKFEKYSDVGCAICLFTADDSGKQNAAKEFKPRARQNVVFETGYFIGKLGRDRIVILSDEGIEIPSDLSGVVYTNTDNWRIDLLKDLKAMGFDVNFNKLF